MQWRLPCGMFGKGFSDNVAVTATKTTIADPSSAWDAGTATCRAPCARDPNHGDGKRLETSAGSDPRSHRVRASSPQNPTHTALLRASSESTLQFWISAEDEFARAIPKTPAQP